MCLADAVFTGDDHSLDRQLALAAALPFDELPAELLKSAQVWSPLRVKVIFFHRNRLTGSCFSQTEHGRESLDRLLKDAGMIDRDTTRRDGNCMFFALADQLACTFYPFPAALSLQEKAARVRATIAAAVLQHNGRLRHLTAFMSAQERSDLATEGGWGSHAVLTAAANLFCRNIRVISSSGLDITIRPDFEAGQKLADVQPTLLLGHEAELHYISLEVCSNGYPSSYFCAQPAAPAMSSAATPA